MKRISPALLLLLNLFFSGKMNAQIAFQRVDTIPVIVNGVTLNNAWAGGINFPLISEIDLNGDGIQDLFVYDRLSSSSSLSGRISTFINDGTTSTNAWHYAPEYISHFPPINRWAFLYDYNCDGKMDLFMLSPACMCGIGVYRNDYNTTNGLEFTLVTQTINELYFSTLSNLYASTVSLPTFGDVDGDGDMDILGYDVLPNGRIVYHKNYSVEHGHGCDSLDFKMENATWGNFQLQIGGTNSVQCFSCRLAASAVDSLVNYDQSQAAVKDDTISSVFMIDIDGDGDKDLLFGDQNSRNSLLVVNGGTAASAQMVSQDTLFPSANIPVNMTDFTRHAYIDVDNDNKKDLIVSPTELENQHGMWFYKNTGTTAQPDFHFQTSTFLVDQMIDVGEGACPVLFDTDGDGLQDLVIGNYGIFQSGTGTYKNGLHVFKNIGTATSPSFQLVNNDYENIGSLNLTGPLFPAFGDLDGDTAKDMIIGEDDGKFTYFHNAASAGQPASFPNPVANYMNIDVGNNSTPQLIDLNHDGLLDIVTGNKKGILKYFQNAGTSTIPFFSNVPTKDTLGGIIVQTIGTPDGFSVPFFFDDNGQYKLLVSCAKGDVYLYDSIDGNLNGNFHFVDTIVTGTQGSLTRFNLAVSGGDLNNDGKTDMLLGIYSGGVQVYMQYHPSGVAELQSVQPQFLISPNPSKDECVIQLFNMQSSEKYRLNVMNYLGQNVFSESISSNNLLLDTRKFSSGVYMIQLLSSKSSVTQKMIVSH